MVASGSVCCPSPAPGTHWRVNDTPPALCIGRYEGTTLLLGRRGEPPCGAAIATKMATAPQYVCGAAMLGWHLGTEITSEHGTGRRRRRQLHGGKKTKNPLSGVVCLLTKRGLISVGRALAPSEALALLPVSLLPHHFSYRPVASLPARASLVRDLDIEERLALLGLYDVERALNGSRQVGAFLHVFRPPTARLGDLGEIRARRQRGDRQHWQL